ncbi:MAG: hypothetical protein WC530_03830 [Candidatus Omnitrophota bacterium]|jgi:hypothetical protein
MKYRKLADLQKGIEGLDCKLELTPEHKVIYREQGGDKKAVFTGSLVAAKPDLLVISVTVQEDEKHFVAGLVKLSGKWELDEKNRITFSVKRGLDRYDKLTFQGVWEVNDNFQVTYTFETRQVVESSGKERRRVTKVTQELVFEGRWDISEKNCLTYLIGVDSESSFRFKGTFGTKSILAKEGEIRYQVGVEYELKTGGFKRMTQTITLFGKWKLSDDLALSFELECADGRKAAISVGVELDLEKFQESCPLLPDKVSVNLTSREGDPLGVEIVLTKDLFEGNVQTFVRFRESLKETAVEAGITIPW